MTVRSCTGVAPSDVAWMLSSMSGLPTLPKRGLVVPAVITTLQEASNAPFTYTTEPLAPVIGPTVTAPSDITRVGAAKTARLAVNTAMKIAVFSISFLMLISFLFCATPLTCEWFSPWQRSRLTRSVCGGGLKTPHQIQTFRYSIKPSRAPTHLAALSYLYATLRQGQPQCNVTCYAAMTCVARACSFSEAKFCREA